MKIYSPLTNQTSESASHPFQALSPSSADHGEERRFNELFHQVVEQALRAEQFFRRYTSAWRTVACFGVSHPEEAQLFLLAEDHTDRWGHRLQGELILALAATQPSIPVLCEGLSRRWRANGDRFCEKRALQCLSDRLNLIGWDAEDDVIGTALPYWQHEEIGKQLLKWARHINFLEDRVEELERGAASSETTEREKKRTIQLTKARRDLQKFEREFTHLWEWWKKAEIAQPEKIADAFPLRTQAMVQTLQEEVGRRPSLERIFLIAGAHHLIDQSHVDSRFDLSRLFRQLDHMKAVILSPRHADFPIVSNEA